MGHASSWCYDVTLAPLASNVGVARGLIGDCLVEHDLPFLVEDIRMVTSEFATNAVVHAGTPFTVRLEGSADRVRLSVSDNSELGPVVGVPSAVSGSGRGLTIVEVLTSEWGVIDEKRNAKSVWALFEIDRWSSPAAGEQGTSVSSQPPRGTGR